ncbi:MAG TPA: hypothetical protein VMT20_08530 [Terriglobia bacterium]|nr:hypothetical protein [Terriglobia bacterium]
MSRAVPWAGLWSLYIYSMAKMAMPRGTGFQPVRGTERVPLQASRRRTDRTGRSRGLHIFWNSCVGGAATEG